MVVLKLIAAYLTFAGKYGGVAGAWQDALCRAHVAEKISTVRTQLAVAACMRRMRHLTDEERAAAICELTSEEWRSIEAAVMRAVGNSLQAAGQVVAVVALMCLSACASSDHDATCAFSTTAQYTLTVVGASTAQPQSGTLACLTDQDTADDCMTIVPMCDGETLTITSPRYPDRLFSYTVVSSDSSGIVARYEDVSAHTGYVVHLREI